MPIRPDPRAELWRAGVLDPDEALDVAERVGDLGDAEAVDVGDPNAVRAADGRVSVARAGAELGDLEAVELGAWRVPPPGVGLALRVSRPAVLAPTRMVTMGERFGVHLPPQADGLEVLVLRQRRGGWEVLAGPVPLPRVAREADGHRLDLVARGPRGRQRWAIALVPAGTPLHGPHEWAGLQAAVASGVATVGALEIEVG